MLTFVLCMVFLAMFIGPFIGPFFWTMILGPLFVCRLIGGHYVTIRRLVRRLLVDFGHWLVSHCLVLVGHTVVTHW